MRNFKTKLISIITPCYNDNEIVKRAIYTALQQDIPDGELILVDDGSSTPVENIWGNRVKLIRHPKNRGLSAALNTGIQAAKNDRFVILSADDMFRSDWAKIMLPHLEKADIISSDFIGETGKVVECKPGSLKDLPYSNCHSYAAIIKKSIWEKVGGFQEYMNPSWEDWAFFLGAALKGATWYHVPEPVHIYHRNPHGRDADAQDKEILLKGKLEGTYPEVFGEGRGLVTFVIPCYNQEQFVVEALQSINNQIYPHVRAVIVDDGSPGDILSFLKEATNLPPYILLRQKNKGLSAARNAGIKYALQNFKSQYLVMLDADDKVHPNFVENCLSAMEPQSYVYTDIEFFGAGSGEYILPDFNCKALSRRHLHACTFLMESIMWQEIVQKRGYGYDENMLKGYEDWEFILAAVESGYCGKRIPDVLFYYRQHANGSMRTEATKINNELARYITTKHRWMEGSNAMPCGSCGGRRMTGRVSFSSNGGKKVYINVPGVGEVERNAVIEVTFHGHSTHTQTKIGQGLPGKGSTVYKFSGNPDGTYKNVFNIFAIDAHLFVGPFTFKKFVPKVEIEEVVESHVQRTEVVFDHETVAIDPDDLTQVKGLGTVAQKKLNEAGIFHFHQLTDAKKVAEILSFSLDRSKKIVEEAKSMKELENVT